MIQITVLVKDANQFEPYASAMQVNGQDLYNLRFWQNESSGENYLGKGGANTGWKGIEAKPNDPVTITVRDFDAEIAAIEQARQSFNALDGQFAIDLRQLPPGSLIFDNRDISGWVADAFLEVTSSWEAPMMSSQTHILLNPSAVQADLTSWVQPGNTVNVKMTTPGREFESRGLIIDRSPSKITLENVMLPKTGA